MIRTRRLRDVTWFDLDDGSAEITVYGGMVNIRISYHSDVAQLDTDDAVSMLRAMLREIVGPSIDDVREVWGVAHADMEVQAEDVFAGYTEATVCVWDGSRHRCFDATTLREALQAAYDAGVEMRGGSDPPA